MTLKHTAPPRVELTMIPPILLLVTLIILTEPPVPTEIGTKKGASELAASEKGIFPVAV